MTCVLLFTFVNDECNSTGRSVSDAATDTATQRRVAECERPVVNNKLTNMSPCGIGSVLLLFIFGVGDVVMLDCVEGPVDVVSGVVLLLADGVERPT